MVPSLILLTGAAALLLLPVNNVDALLLSPTAIFADPRWFKNQNRQTITTPPFNIGRNRGGRLHASSSSASTPALASTLEEAKDNLRRALEASGGSTLGDDVLAAAEVSSHGVCLFVVA